MAHAQLPCLSPSRIKVDISSLGTRTSKLWVFTDGISSVAQLLERTLSMISAPHPSQTFRLFLDDGEVPSTAPLSMLRENDNIVLQRDISDVSSVPAQSGQAPAQSAPAPPGGPAEHPSCSVPASSQHKYAAPQQHRAHFLGNALFSQAFSGVGRPRKERVDVVGRRGQLADQDGGADEEPSTARLAHKRLRMDIGAPIGGGSTSAASAETGKAGHFQGRTQASMQTWPMYTPTSPPSSPRRADIEAMGEDTTGHPGKPPVSPSSEAAQDTMASCSSNLHARGTADTPQGGADKAPGKKTRRGCRAGRKHKKRSKEVVLEDSAMDATESVGAKVGGGQAAPPPQHAAVEAQEKGVNAQVSLDQDKDKKPALPVADPQSIEAGLDAMPFLTFGRSGGRGAARSEGPLYEVFSARADPAVAATSHAVTASAATGAQPQGQASGAPAPGTAASSSGSGRPRLRASIMGVSRALGMLVAAQAAPASSS